jgi:hypothetical protein
MASSSLRITGSIALLALTIAACSDPAANPLDPDPIRVGTNAVGGGADIGEFELCAVGPQSIFRAIVDSVPQSPARFRLGPDNCVVIATTAQLGPGNHLVTIIEDILTGQGQVLDSIVSTVINVQTGVPVRGAPLTGTRMVSQIFNGDRGWLVEFYNH